MSAYTERYKWVPHMREYDQFHFVPHPYTMFRTRPDHSSKEINTDRYGGRLSTLADGSTVSAAGIARYDRIGIILGGSAAFGWGATCDAATIPSVLNRLDPSTAWINMGGCTYQTFQELISLLMLVPPEKISRLVLFSGVNAAFLTLFEGYSDPNVPFFFKFSEYWKPIREQAENIQRERFFPNARNLVRRLRGRPPHAVKYPPNPFERAEPDLGKRMRAGLDRALRDLAVLLNLSRGAGFTIHYVFQPCLIAGSKELCEEEREIIRVLDAMYREDNPMARLGEVAPYFAEEIGKFLRARGAAFANAQPAFGGDEWLYVDRVHLTDLGYEKAAGLIHQLVNEGR